MKSSEDTDAWRDLGRAARESQQQQNRFAFRFTGTGAEYFRIWIVNLLFTIVTLGAYSAWAKVRRLQYFYRNTSVDGAIFDYHGNPKAILKGRVLALLLLAAYKIAFEISGAAALAVALVLLAALPWLLARSLRFKMINSSYRGLRFHFGGGAAQAYKMLSLFPVLAALIAFYLWNLATSSTRVGLLGVLLGIALLLVAAGALPLGHFLLKRYQHDHAYFGQAPFFFHAGAGDFFQIYRRALGLLALGSVSVGVFGFLTRKLFDALQSTMFGWLFAMFYSAVSAYALYLFVRPYLESRIQNLVWNHTELGCHRFVSSASAHHLLMLHATNLLAITFTLGLYQPFAAIRLMKYRIESLRLLPDGDLEHFLADQSGDHAGAIGQEAGELFDIEIAL
ncbi:MAG: DUF898 domain-containing protein [Burkholderiaceae bacterium]|nr:DUF898 domain-containing protein [Burkholderiaceae bacterium]